MPTTRRPDPAKQRATREARRLQAAELFAQGHSQAEVACTLGVSRQSAHLWHTRFAQGGVDALRSRGPTGPDPKLSAAQLAKIEEALLAEAMANGFDTDLWTLERVAVVITQLTGVRHHPGHVWSILRHRLGGACNARSGGPASATRRRSSAGSSRSGRGSKGGRRQVGLACLHGRIGRLADPTGAPHLVTARPHADPAPSVWLEEGLYGGCPGVSG
jgi:transposase